MSVTQLNNQKIVEKNAVNNNAIPTYSSPKKKGVLAGIAQFPVVTVFYPIDLIEKYQIIHRETVFNSVKTLYKERFRPTGLMISYPMVCLSRAASFFVYESLKEQAFMHPSANGYLAGLSSRLVVAPFDLMKVRMQTSHNPCFQKVTHHLIDELNSKKGGVQKGTFFLRGQWANLFKAGVGSSIWFPMRDYFKGKLIAHEKTDPWKVNAGVGALASLITSFVTFPFEITKVHAQVKQKPVLLLESIKKVMKSPIPYYKNGFPILGVRATFQGAMTNTIYEYLLRVFED